MHIPTEAIHMSWQLNKSQNTKLAETSNDPMLHYNHVFIGD